MTITQIYKTVCNAHSACHTLARAVEGLFHGSKLECTHHDTSGILCAHEGSINFGDAAYGLFIRSTTRHEVEITVAAEAHGHEAVFNSIVEAYQALRDASGFEHTLERQNQID